MQAGDDDNEAFEPHAHLHDQRNHEQRRHVAPDARNPQERLRCDDVAQDEHPVDHGVRAGHAVQNHVAVERIAAVKRHERFHHVAVGHDQARGEQYLGHVVEVPQGDEVFQVIVPAQRDGQGQDHGKSRIDGARHEIGREDRAVPPGNNGDGEVETDHGMDRDHERRGQAREQERRHLVATPVYRRPAPPHRQNAVSDLGEAPSSPVAQGREIRDQSHEPEHHRDRGVGGHCEHVPDQRTPELRPRAHRVSIGEEPIEEPRPPQVQQGEHSRARYRKQRHGLGKAVDRGSPLLAHEQQES